MDLHLPIVLKTAKMKVVCHDLNMVLQLGLMLLTEMLTKVQLSLALLPWTLAAHVMLLADLLQRAPCLHECSYPVCCCHELYHYELRCFDLHCCSWLSGITPGQGPSPKQRVTAAPLGAHSVWVLHVYERGCCQSCKP